MSTRVGIDPQVLGAATGGNAEVADRIVQRYLSVAGEEIEQLAELLERGDRAALRRQAHQVVGAAATVGAVAVEAAGRALEDALAEGSGVPVLAPLIERTAAAFQALTD